MFSKNEIFMYTQKNNAFCSICTVNYLAYAGTLSESLKKVGHNEPHYVLVVDYDKKYKEIVERFRFKPVFLSELAIPKINELIEKYSAFELSNVLKPFFMEWLLKKHNEINKLVFLDTDIYVYSSLNEIFDYFDDNLDVSVAITPHLKDYQTYNKISDYSIEKLYALSGMYNGGFYALRNDKNAFQFLDWHKKKLFDYGYNRQSEHMFVDQKILDFAPIFFKYVGIYRNQGYNVAHWNYHEHPIEYKNSSYFIGDKRLVFFHFSHLKIDKKNIAKSSLFNLTLDKKIVLQKLVLEYWKYIEKNDYEKIINIPYGYKDKYKESPISLTNPLLAKEMELNSTKDELRATKTELESRNSELSSVKTELESRNSELSSVKTELERVYASREWKSILKLKKLAGVIIPKESYRRKIAVKSWRLTKTPMKATQEAKVKLLAFKNYLGKFKPRKKRKINLKSKKIVFVDHSFHSKTKSSAFVTDYLKQFYDVKIILDDSWQGKPFVDLSFIDESYLCVIFWQSLPDRKTIENIKNDNLLFFPMNDQSGRLELEYWEQYKTLKIANFSRTLHNKLKDWGFESIFVQYFPDVQKFQPGRKGEVFFWQRLTYINIDKVVKLFKNRKVKIHLHKAVDPDQKFIEPSKEDEKKFQITYSDWFDTKEEMWDLIKQKGIYVAPREFEGIGMSFLEAMAMGKAVVAVNNPTMNEYIEDGKTGYLFDLENPKEIDFKDIEKVQKNTYAFMQKGYKSWQKDKKKIIDFIKKI